MTKKVLHVANVGNFFPGFIELVSKHFPTELHTFITYEDVEKYQHLQSENIKSFPKLISFRCMLTLVIAMHRNDKIILHGIFGHYLAVFLCFMPWLHKKCEWIILGGDLYYHKLAEKNLRYYVIEHFRKFLISRLGALITYVDGDYNNARDWYNANGKHYECIMYKSNVFSGEVLTKDSYATMETRDSDKVTIQVGNSADPSNNHKQIFERLAQLDIQNQVVKIYCPLSYGNRAYAEEIKQLGESLFGDRFYPLMDFIPLEKYNAILDEINIAVFAHNRQQAMGNKINLLGRGKAVYMRSDISSYALFKKLGITVYSLDDISLRALPQEIAIANNNRVCNYFTEENLVKQLEIIFT